MSKRDKKLQRLSSNPIDAWIPQNLQNMTIGNLLSDPDVEFRGGKGSLVMRRNIEGSRVTLRVDKREHYGEVSEFVVDRDMSREDRDRTIIDLRVNHKMTQQEIADKLDISQSGVSQILKRNKDKKK